MKNVAVIGGSSNQELAKKVSKLLDKKHSGNVIEYFANSEFRPRIQESVRTKDIFILQTGGYFDKKNLKSANDYLMEIYILAKTLKRSDAKTINLIVPFFPYSREDKKDSEIGSISARDVADLFEFSGINRVITFDLHSPQIQGFFQIPCDNLQTTHLIEKYLRQKFFENNKNYRDEYILVAPDEGAFKRTKELAQLLKLPFVTLSKQRDYSKKNVVEKMVLIGDKEQLKNKNVIVMDDIIDTFGTINKSSKILAQNGASGLIVVATHGIFSSSAIELINKNDFVKFVLVSDSIPQQNHLKISSKIEVFSLASVISYTIKRIMNNNG